MKKNNFKKLAFLGVVSGTLLAAQNTVQASEPATTEKTAPVAAKSITEPELLSKLNDEGKKAYESLSLEGKKLAQQYAVQTCAGKSGCQYGGGNFKDKNDAVKAAAKKMTEKREAGQ